MLTRPLLQRWRKREHRARGMVLEEEVVKSGWLPWPRLGRCWPEGSRCCWKGCSLLSGSLRAGPVGRCMASQPSRFSPTQSRNPPPGGRSLQQRMGKQSIRTPVAAQEAPPAPEGLQPVLANLLQLLRRPSLLPLTVVTQQSLLKPSSGPTRHRPPSWPLLALGPGLPMPFTHVCLCKSGAGVSFDPMPSTGPGAERVPANSCFRMSEGMSQSVGVGGSPGEQGSHTVMSRQLCPETSWAFTRNRLMLNMSRAPSQESWPAGAFAGPAGTWSLEGETESQGQEEQVVRASPASPTVGTRTLALSRGEQGGGRIRVGKQTYR